MKFGRGRGPDQYTLTGDLTIKDNTRPASRLQRPTPRRFLADLSDVVSVTRPR